MEDMNNTKPSRPNRCIKFHPRIADYIFSSEHGIFSRVGYKLKLGHKTSFSKLKRISTVYGFWLQWNETRNNKRKFG